MQKGIVKRAFYTSRHKQLVQGMRAEFNDYEYKLLLKKGLIDPVEEESSSESAITDYPEGGELAPEESELTPAEIKEKLKALNVEFNAKSNQATLLKLLIAAQDAQAEVKE